MKISIEGGRGYGNEKTISTFETESKKATILYEGEKFEAIIQSVMHVTFSNVTQILLIGAPSKGFLKKVLSAKKKEPK